MSSSATKHSIDRAMERRKLKNHRAAEKNIANAIKNGKRAEDFSSWERSFLLGEERDGCSAIAYNNFCYIVNSEDVCITLYPLPVWFGKKKRFDGKERIRDYKKYQKNYSLNDDETFGSDDDLHSFRGQGEVYADVGGREIREQGAIDMSRDWTPGEFYMVEQSNLKNGGLSIFESMRSTIVSYNGKTWPRYSEEEMDTREQFPMLGKLLGPFMELYERLSKYENGIEFLKMQDLELQEFISTGNHNPNSYLVRWFKGDLVDNFHYREPNDAALIEFVCEEAMQHTGKQYDAYMEYLLNWYAEHGVSDADIARMKAEYLEDVENGRFDGTFHQYEMEVGYENVGIYDSFDIFLEKEWLKILERHQSFREGDFIDVIVDSHCQGLAKVLCITENGLFLEMIDGHYSMIPPKTKLSNNPFEADYNVILELRVVDPKNYNFVTHHETVSELIFDAKTRCESFAGNETDKIVDYVKE